MFGPTCASSNRCSAITNRNRTSVEYSSERLNMAASRESLEQRAWAYAEEHAVLVETELGYGNDGIIWATDRKSAIKVMEREASYVHERDCYVRLQDRSVAEIEGLAVPQLVAFDDRLWVVEMTIVQPPFLLDFAKAYVDRPPELSPEVLADWETETAEFFGDNWPAVQSVLGWLAATESTTSMPSRGTSDLPNTHEEVS